MDKMKFRGRTSRKPLNLRISREQRRKIPLVSDENVRAVFEIRFLKEISIIRKKNVFLCLPLSVRMSSKQNTGTEQDILLWNIMKMKFVFIHFTFPSAYLGPHFIIVTVA